MAIKRNHFVINGVDYLAKPFDFNTICEMEEAGVSLDNIQKRPMSTVRAYFTVCSGGDAEQAGKELQKHMIDGGDVEGIMTAMSKELENSDFFQALGKRAEEETGASKDKATPQKK